MWVKDSFFLARLARGRSPAGRVRAGLPELSPQFQPVAARLLAADPEDRQSIWDDFLAGRPRRDAIRGAVAEPAGLEKPAHDESAATHRPSSEVAAAPIIPQAFPAAPQQESGVNSGRRVRLTCAADLKPRAVEWLWSGRVPLGMITMFAGDPKLGKSYVTLAMAAALSRGLPLPLSDQPNHPGSAILMSAEDDPARTIVPRLVAAGADLAKVHILESVVLADGAEALPSLRADIDVITTAATRLGDCRLIVIDPVSAYLKGVDDNRNTALRGALTPLCRLAERLTASVVLVSHLNKVGSANGKHRVLGSIAYVGACRANHFFIADPNDRTGRRVLMLDNGGNVAPPAPALAYTIEHRDTGPQIEWSDTPVTNTLGRPLQPAESIQSSDEERAGRHHACERWLCAFLADGPRTATDVLSAAVNGGFSKDQVRRVRSRWRRRFQPIPGGFRP